VLFRSERDSLVLSVSVQGRKFMERFAEDIK
jgi:hypothetical protein